MIMACMKMPLRYSSGSVKRNYENFVRGEFEPDNSQIQVSFVVAVQTFPLKPSNFRVDKYKCEHALRGSSVNTLCSFINTTSIVVGRRSVPPQNKTTCPGL